MLVAPVLLVVRSGGPTRVLHFLGGWGRSVLGRRVLRSGQSAEILGMAVVGLDGSVSVAETIDDLRDSRTRSPAYESLGVADDGGRARIPGPTPDREAATEHAARGGHVVSLSTLLTSASCAWTLRDAPPRICHLRWSPGHH